MIDPAETPPELTTSLKFKSPFKDVSGSRLAKEFENPKETVERINIKREELHKKYPEIIPQIDSAFEFFCGMILHAEEMQKEKLPPEQVVNQSCLQHNFVHHLYFAGLPNTDNYFKSIIYNSALAMQNTAAALNREGNIALSYFWAGIKNELAIVKTLFESGYKVMLPEYFRDPLKRHNETLELDVKSQVDLIAQKDNRMWLVDAKGKSENTDLQVFTAPYTYQKGDNWILKHLIANLKPEETYRATIILPGGLIPSLERIPDFKQDLFEFGRLPKNISLKIALSLQGNNERNR